MKKLITVAALTAALASPAFAWGTAPYSQGDYDGNRPNLSTTPPAAGLQDPRTARAEAVPAVRNSRAAVTVQPLSPSAVYFGGEYLGSDPDPNVRLNMVEEYIHRQ